MFVAEKQKALVLNLRNPANVMTVVPKAKVLKTHENGVTTVVVPHTLDVYRVLNNINIKAPHPIKHYYNWPCAYPAPMAHQIETAAFLSRHPRAYCLNGMGCVDSSTEYLSPEGWRRIDSYDGGQVLQYDKATARASWVQPSRYIDLPCDEFIHIKTGRGLDQMLSSEHRVLLQDGRRQEVVSAEELLRRHDEWLATGQNKKRAGRIGFKKAGLPVSFTATGGEGIALTNDQIRLQVAVIADGYFPNKSNTCVVRLKRPRKVERMRALLDACGVEYKLRVMGPGEYEGFHIFRFAAPRREKEFAGDWWRCSALQLSQVADEVMYWDGSISPLESRGPRFASTSRSSVDFVQYALAGTGRYARAQFSDALRPGATKPCHNLSSKWTGAPVTAVSVGADGTRRRTIERVATPGARKYCFEVPTGFLVLRRNGQVFVTGNSAKTLSALWAFDYLRSVGKAKRCLVVAPLSTLERTWADEVFRHFPNMTFSVVHDAKRSRRLRILAEGSDVCITNHDGIKVINKELLAEKFDVVILDELTQLARNTRTERWKAARSLVESAKYTWGLTGTPIPNDPCEAYGQIKLLTPGNVPRSYTAFQDMVTRLIGPYKRHPLPNAAETVYRMMQPSIRYATRDCVDLPPTVYMQRHVPLSEDQARAYKLMEREKYFQLQVSDPKIVAVNEAVVAMKLIQVAVGAVYNADGEVQRVEAPERLAETIDCIEQAEGKVIVFCPVLGAIDYIVEKLREKYGEHAIGQIDGRISASQRASTFSSFQNNGAVQVIVAQPSAMSHGLTLTAGSMIVWFAPCYSNETYEQANARIVRPGQKRTTIIVNIEGTKLEEKIYKRLKERQRIQGQLLELAREG